MELTHIKLDRQFDPSSLVADLKRAHRQFKSAPQGGQYHDGSWTGIALKNNNGAHDNTLALHTGHSKYTDVVKVCPYFKALLDQFGESLLVARILFLPAGKVIGEHTDRGFGWNKGLLRLHIPLVCDDRVEFILGGQRMDWHSGELWYADFAQPHSLRNDGDSVRVHLVLDCLITEELLTLFPEAFLAAVREKNSILMWEPKPVAAKELQAYTGNLKLEAPVLGMNMPLSGFIYVDQNLLAVKLAGLPFTFHLTPSGPHCFRCNHFEIRWQGAPKSIGINWVECTNLATGQVHMVRVAHRLSFLSWLMARFQSVLLGSYWGGHLFGQRLKQYLHRFDSSFQAVSQKQAGR